MENPVNSHQSPAIARFASAAILVCAARCLRIGYKRWLDLDTFAAGSIALVMMWYVVGLLLVLLAIYRPPRLLLRALERASNHPLSRFRQSAVLRTVTTFGAPAIAFVILARPIVASYDLDEIGSDGMLFSRYAVQRLLAGQSPYSASMDAALAEHPEIIPTYRIDGTPVADLSYPSLSFLAFVPQEIAGLRNLNLTSLLVLAMTTLWLIWRSPVELKWFPLFLLGADWSVVAFSAGGVFDILWVLPLLWAMQAFERVRFASAGTWFGVACCVKQTPWFIAPFIAIALATRVDPGARLRSLAKLAGSAISVFVLLNSPFMIADFSSWLRGVLTPIAGGMSLVPFGSGLVELELAGLLHEPKYLFTLAMAFAFTVSAITYAAHSKRSEGLAWVAPMFILWFNFRSPHNYYVFFMFVAYATVMFRTEARDNLTVHRGRASWLPTAAASGSIAILVLIGLFNSPTSLACDLHVESAGDPDELGRVSELRVFVANRGSRPIHPVFALISSKHSTPLFWTANGPTELDRGGSAAFDLHAPVWSASLPRNADARLVVYDRGTEHRVGTIFRPERFISQRTTLLDHPSLRGCSQNTSRAFVTYRRH